MRPTELADYQFVDSLIAAEKSLENDNAPEYIRDLGRAIRGLSGGMRQMNVGLRATYILLEQIKTQMDRPQIG